MERLTTKEELLEGLKDALALEIIAKKSYESDIEMFKNKKIKKTFENIKDEEDEHIFMLNELIKMLEKGD